MSLPRKTFKDAQNRIGHAIYLGEKGLGNYGHPKLSGHGLRMRAQQTLNSYLRLRVGKPCMKVCLAVAMPITAE